MCGRFTLFSDYQEIIDRFDIESSIEEGQYIQSYKYCSITASIGCYK